MCKIECARRRYGQWLGMVMSSVLLVACAQERAQLQFDPAVVSACEIPVEVDVTWDASALGLEQVYLEVAELGLKPKLWVQSSAMNSQRTGKWISDGSTITLYAMDGTRLARRTLTTTPCENEATWRWW